MLEKIRDCFRKSVEETAVDQSFYPFMDCAGNELHKENVAFTDIEKYLKHRSSGDKQWVEHMTEETGFYTVLSKGVTPVLASGDGYGSFPIALKVEEDGVEKTLTLKVSRKSGELLPLHCGTITFASFLLAGPPSSGKTCYALEQTSESFFNLIWQKGFSIANDMPVVNDRYHDVREKFFNEHLVPGTTLASSDIPVYYYEVSFKHNAQTKDCYTKRVLIRLNDVDGESCLSLNKKVLFSNNHVYLFVGGDELQKNEGALFFQMMDRIFLHKELGLFPKNVKFTVVISKIDLLLKKEQEGYPSLELENSLMFKDGKLVQSAHANGFDYKFFFEQDRQIRSFLAASQPNFLGKLENTLGSSLTFAGLGSVGTKPVDNKFETLAPISIDQPLLYFLADSGLYKVAECDEEHEAKKTSVQTVEFGEWLKEFKKKFEDFEEVFIDEF